jgi:hypothetical protein
MGEQPGLERSGQPQAAHDAGQDQHDVHGAELPCEGAGDRGADALLQQFGEASAVVDQHGKNAENAAGAGGLRRGDSGRVLGGIRRGGNGRGLGGNWRVGIGRVPGRNQRVVSLRVPRGNRVVG